MAINPPSNQSNVDVAVSGRFSPSPLALASLVYPLLILPPFVFPSFVITPDESLAFLSRVLVKLYGSNHDHQHYKRYQ